MYVNATAHNKKFSSCKVIKEIGVHIIYLSIYLSIHLSISPPSIFHYIFLSIYLSFYLSIYLSIYLSDSVYLANQSLCPLPASSAPSPESNRSRNRLAIDSVGVLFNSFSKTWSLSLVVFMMSSRFRSLNDMRIKSSKIMFNCDYLLVGLF